MPDITITQGALGATDLPDGVYTLVLTKCEGPKTIDTVDGPKDILEWTFTVYDGDYFDTEIQDSTSTATSPRSKMYAWISALAGGRSPEIGASFNTDVLLGRVAIGTVEKNDRGWPRIKTLSAIPEGMQHAVQAQAFSDRQPAHVPAAAQSRPAATSGAQGGRARAAAAAPQRDDNLPF
jgi:hypothetical protein